MNPRKLKEVASFTPELLLRLKFLLGECSKLKLISCLPFDNFIRVFATKLFLWSGQKKKLRCEYQENSFLWLDKMQSLPLLKGF